MPPVRRARPPAALIAAAAFAAGCATGQGGSAPTGEMLSGDCNPLVTGGIGAAIGALVGGSKHRAEGGAGGGGPGPPDPRGPGETAAAIGALVGGSKHRAEGAAAGAAIGALACVAYNYYAKQTKT